MKIQNNIKKIFRFIDKCLKVIIPLQILEKFFPFGSLYTMVKIKFLRRNSKILILSPLYEFNSKIPWKYRVAFFNGCPDGGRSERYRVYDQVNYLTRHGIVADVYSYKSLSYLKKTPFYDLLIIFRANNGAEPKMKALLQEYKQRNIPIIYDVDDNLFERCSREEYEMSMSTMKLCDVMTVSTHYLKNLYTERLKKDCYIIPITISKEQYDFAQVLIKNRKREQYDNVFISYLSGSNTHDEDFKEILKPLEYILSKYSNTRLVIVGPLNIPSELEMFSSQIIRKRYMEPSELLKLTSKMDINLAPLTIDSFNQGKGETKVTEAALVKVLTVASPIKSYKELINNGINGFIAYTLTEWQEILELLITNKEIRNKIGSRAYEDFVQKYYLEQIGSSIVDFHQRLIMKNK